jgi:hypothetical protein
MYITPAPTATGLPFIPPKIQAALAFTSFCEHVQNQMHQTVSGVEKIGRKLSSGEQRCYDAAIACMTEYFNDDGFGDAPPPNPPGGGNAPVLPQVPVNVS